MQVREANTNATDPGPSLPSPVTNICVICGAFQNVEPKSGRVPKINPSILKQAKIKTASAWHLFSSTAMYA
jgi:hypothetical protein